MNKASILRTPVLISKIGSKSLLHLELAKIPRCIFISFSSFFGYVICRAELSPTLILTTTGIFLLACGCATLNNLQDLQFDRLLNRTKNRALPLDKISKASAASQAVVLIFAGLLFIYEASNVFLPVFLSALSIVLYNFVYTKMKPETVLAIFPGAVCGMLPPFIGWLAAGGPPIDLTILTIVLFFGLWQVPHFWLVVLNHHEDYNESTLLSILNVFSVPSMKRILFVWIISFSLLMQVLILMDVLILETSRWLLILNAWYLIIISAVQLFLNPKADFRKLFLALNTSLMVTMVIAVFERFVVFK